MSWSQDFGQRLCLAALDDFQAGACAEAHVRKSEHGAMVVYIGVPGGVRDRANSKIHEIDEKIGRLRAMRRRLRAIVRCRCDGNCPIVARALSERSPK